MENTKKNFTSLIIKINNFQKNLILYENVNDNHKQSFTSIFVQNFSYEKKLETFHNTVLVFC